MTAADMRQLSFAQAVNEALSEALSDDPTVVLFGEDIVDSAGGGVFGVTLGLSSKHGLERVRATPISEQAIAGAAVGAAMAGLRPVAEIMVMDFLPLAMDQLVVHGAKLRYMSGGRISIPLTIRMAAGGGLQFGAQHSDMFESWLCHVPGLKVVVASTPADAKGLLRACIFDPDPCIFVEQTRQYATVGPVPDRHYEIPLGKADVKRPGTDVTVVTYGRQVQDAHEAADSLAATGIVVEILDLRTLVPLDTDAIIESVNRTRRAIVVHEAVRRGGYGAEIASIISENLFGHLLAPVVRVGAADTPVPYAANLESAYLPQAADIEKAVQAVMNHQ